MALNSELTVINQPEQSYLYQNENQRPAFFKRHLVAYELINIER